MRSLQGLATAVSSEAVSLPSGSLIRVESWLVRFPAAVPARLPLGVLAKTYTDKPLVDVDGESLFGELAVVRWLAKDGWEALWADTFHHRKFWRDMPQESEPVQPPTHVKALYDDIVLKNHGASGCFDVVAWKGKRIAWLEYKGPGDRENRNESRWLQAAIEADVGESDLIFVGSQVRVAREKKAKRAKQPASDILWAKTTDTSHCGHGVEFHHVTLPQVVVAFAVGFGWLHEPGTPVTVEILKTPPDGVSAKRWSAIVEETKLAVREYFDGPPKLSMSLDIGPVSARVNG